MLLLLATAGVTGCRTLLTGTRLAAALLLPLPVPRQQSGSQAGSKVIGSGEAQLLLQQQQQQPELQRATKLLATCCLR